MRSRKIERGVTSLFNSQNRSLRELAFSRKFGILFFSTKGIRQISLSLYGKIWLPVLRNLLKRKMYHEQFMNNLRFWNFFKISADVLVVEVIKILILGLSAIIFSISVKVINFPQLLDINQINLPEGLLICLVTNAPIAVSPFSQNRN